MQSLMHLWHDMSHGFGPDIWHVRRGQPHLLPSAMEYSLQSNCLVSLSEGGEIAQAPAAYASAVTVLDLAAGGRMLCRLGDML